MLSIIALVISLLALFIIYGGYVILLYAVSLISNLRVDKERTCGELDEDQTCARPISIYMSARNEGKVIERRLNNLLDTDYPIDNMEIIVVSDGSEDDTASVCRSFFEHRGDVKFQIVEWPNSAGRAAAQNKVAQIATNDILVATDADTVFNRRTLTELIKPFVVSDVAVVGGVVEYHGKDKDKSNGKDVISKDYDKYRSMERLIRKLETELRVLVKIDGPCVAYRRYIWDRIEDYEDLDQVITLIARKKGFQSVQADRATCIDKANVNYHQEIIQRARMTRKALLSIFNQWKWEHACRFPMFTSALFLHKVLRFFSPIFVMIALIAIIIVCPSYVLYLYVGIIIVVTLMVERLRRLALSFGIAQIGFAIGLFSWARGVKDGAYRPTRDLG